MILRCSFRNIYSILIIIFLATYFAVVQCDVKLCCIILVLEIVVIRVLIQSYVIVRYRYVAV